MDGKQNKSILFPANFYQFSIGYAWNTDLIDSMPMIVIKKRNRKWN